MPASASVWFSSLFIFDSRIVGHFDGTTAKALLPLVEHQSLPRRNRALHFGEFDLVSVAFKNAIGTYRNALRNMQYVAQNPKYQHFSDGLKAYRVKIENQLYDKCEDIIKCIEDKILSKDGVEQEGLDDELKAFFLKMVADYY